MSHCMCLFSVSLMGCTICYEMQKHWYCIFNIRWTQLRYSLLNVSSHNQSIENTEVGFLRRNIKGWMLRVNDTNTVENYSIWGVKHLTRVRVLTCDTWIWCISVNCNLSVKERFSLIYFILIVMIWQHCGSVVSNVTWAWISFQRGLKAVHLFVEAASSLCVFFFQKVSAHRSKLLESNPVKNYHSNMVVLSL